jgi:hypothetical protein
LIARTCGGDRAPAHVHERIKVRITEISIESNHLEFRAD